MEDCHWEEVYDFLIRLGFAGPHLPFQQADPDWQQLRLRTPTVLSFPIELRRCDSSARLFLFQQYLHHPPSDRSGKNKSGLLVPTLERQEKFNIALMKIIVKIIRIQKTVIRSIH
ncbi:MAG: hypothetical protein HQL76_12340 [Magnetococcales bacterium]|nr:hypothetical protein [Magnetococcales bacterium]